MRHKIKARGGANTKFVPLSEADEKTNESEIKTKSNAQEFFSIVAFGKQAVSKEIGRF